MRTHGRRRARLDLWRLEDRTTPSGSGDTVPVNPPPTANDDIADTDGNNPVAVAVLANDAAAAGATLVPGSVRVVSGPPRGTLSVDPATGDITYTASGFFRGSDSFRYTVTDSTGAVSAPATVTVVINRPTANDDFAETDAATPVAIPVLDNDTDPDGNSQIVVSSVAVVAVPSHGTTSVDPATGAVTYTPAAGFTGTDTFFYTITDAAGAASAPGTVTVVVHAAIATPATAADDVADTDGNNPVAVDVLANDAPPAGESLVPGSVRVASGPSRGTVSVDPTTGAITYTAAGFFMGTDSFTYTVAASGGGRSAPAVVSIVINRPTANDDFADTDGTNPVTVDVLANDTDPDGTAEIVPSTVAIVAPPLHGTLAVSTINGAVTYTAARGFSGTDSFTYTVADRAGAVSAPGTVTIVVNRPTANADAATVERDGVVAIAVLANDTDPDGVAELDPASVRVVMRPAHGRVVVNPAPDGRVTYIPDAGYVGPDSFTYTVADFPGAESNVATVSLTVTAPPAPPVTAAGADAGGGPRVTIYNADGTVRSNFFAFEESFTGGVRVAVADVDGDGVADVVAGPGAGGGPRVVVFSGATGQPLMDFFAYDPAFRGGVYVAAGDVTGDGLPDIVTGAGDGGAPHVKVFDGRTGAEVASFFAADSTFRGGVTVAAGDVTGDGRADVVTGTGPGGGPAVGVFDGAGKLLLTFAAFDPAFRGGVYVAAGDVTGDGVADIVAGAGPGGGPAVAEFDGRTGARLRAAFVYAESFGGGVRVALSDVTGDGRDELVVGPGAGSALPTKVLDAETLAELPGGAGFGFSGGTFVGGNG